jgi:hypothetical protein
LEGNHVFPEVRTVVCECCSTFSPLDVICDCGVMMLERSQMESLTRMVLLTLTSPPLF